MEEIYKYNKQISRFYDIVYENLKKDFGHKYYLEEISNAKGPVLEIGAGTGRIFVPALQKGADIYGIDQSELMTEKLREKIKEEDFVRLSIQDAREFSIDQKFKLIIAPFRMFSHLLSIEDQLKTLERVYEHLEPGGKFIFDVFIPDYASMAADAEDIVEFEGEYEPGKMLKRLVSRKQSNINQIVSLTFRFIWDENGKLNEDTCYFPFRYYFRYELENLIARSKLKMDKIYGGFERSELTGESKEFIVVCFKND